MVFFTAAVVLPYVAVVVANTSTRRETLSSAPYFTDDARALEGPPDDALSTRAPPLLVRT